MATVTILAWTAQSDQEGAEFGWDISSAGDVNGDGYGDVAVGAVGAVGEDQDGDDDGGGGAAFVYLGSAAGLERSPVWSAASNQPSAQFGNKVAGGDINGDGFSDLIVAAPLHDHDQRDEGAVFMYLGSRAGLAMTAAWMGESGQPYCQFGTAAAIAGDVDGDGYQDVVIGAADYSDDAPDIGKAYLYLGSSSGLGSSPEWTAESDIGKAYFGHAVSSAGDVDGDGLSDVVVGARHYANGEEDEGRAFLYLGSSSSGLEGSAAWTAEGDQVGADFGFAVASAGDVDGDGYGDVAVGAAHYDTGFGIEGAAFLYLGVSSGLEATAVWSETGGQDGSGFGSSLASAGDVDGDGHGDLLVGASGYDGGSTGEGMAGLFLGSPTGLALDAAWATESDQDGAGLGASVASAGDVDGDGRGDFLLGAPYYDGGSEDEGAAFLYLGFAADSGGEDTGPGDSGAGDSGATPGDSSATPGDSGATPGDSAATTDGTDSGSGAEATDKGGGARCGTLSRPRWSLAVLGLGLGLGLGLRRAGSGR